MNMLKNFFADHGKSEDNMDLEHEAATDRAMNIYSTPKFDFASEQNATFQTSSVQSPNNDQNLNHPAWPTRIEKRVWTSKVTPIVIDKGISNLSRNLNNSPPETTPQKDLKQNNSVKDKIILKTDENFDRKKNSRLKRSTTHKLKAFNPKDYEEKFDIDDLLQQTNPQGRQRGSSAIAVTKHTLDNSSDSSSYEGAENFELSKSLGANKVASKSALDGAEIVRTPEQWKNASKKNSPSLIQSKSPNQLQTATKTEDETASREKTSPVQNNVEKAVVENRESNIDYYEDLEFANRSEDEFSPLVSPKKERKKDRIRSSLRDDPQYRRCKYIIFPDDHRKIAWHMIVIVLLLYTAIVLPLRIAYIDDSDTIWMILDWVLNALFAVDIIVNFLSAYFDQNMTLIVSKRQIARNYIFGWLLFDILAVIPFNLIIGTSNNYQQLIKVAQLSRLYQLLRMTKLIKMIKLFRERLMVMKYVHQALHTKPHLERLFVSFFVIILFVHVSACVWKFLLLFNIDQPNNWLKVYGFYDQSGNQITAEGEIYVASFYMIVQTIATIGYGDLTGYTTDERIACCFWMFIGVFLYSFTIGSLASWISTLDAKQAEFNKKLNILLHLKSEYNFSNQLYLKIKNALRYGIKQAQDNTEFLQSLPTHLNQDLSCIIYQDIIDTIPFFKDRPKSFIATLIPLLRPMKVGKGDYIFLEGDPADEMFFLKSGQVAYVIPKYSNFKFLKIKKGYYFGEIDLLFYGEVRKYTVQASRTCELYVLNKKDFKQMFFMDFRDIGIEFADFAYSRKIRTKRTYKEALSFLTEGVTAILLKKSAALQRQLTSYEGRLLKPEEYEDGEGESAEDPNKRHQFPFLKAAEEQEDMRFHERRKQSSKSMGSMPLFATTRFPDLESVQSEGEIAPISQRLSKTMSKTESSRSKFLKPSADHFAYAHIQEMDELVLTINEKVNRLLHLSTNLQPSNVNQPKGLLTPPKMSKKFDFEMKVQNFDSLPDFGLENKSITISPEKDIIECSKDLSNCNPLSKKAPSVVLDSTNEPKLREFARSDNQVFGHDVSDRQEEEPSGSEEENPPMLKDFLMNNTHPKPHEEKQGSPDLN